MTDSTTPPDIEQEALQLRRRLAEELTAAGRVRSSPWREAVETVPRHEFLPELFTATSARDGTPTQYTPVNRSAAGPWLALAYSDETFVTQLGGALCPGDVVDPVSGIPTSSSTMPSLVMSMWEDLEVSVGDRVLEIGTGTGYSTALGCHRLGDDRITSIEVDPAVAARARAALDRVGYHPDLVVGDGAAGVAIRAPFDRVIATCAWRSVPPAWIEQCRPGALILVTLSGWLGATGLVRLTVTDPAAGTASGGFVDPDVGFMPARSEAAEFVFIPDRDDRLISKRPAVFGPDLLDNATAARQVVQLAAPNAQYLQAVADEDGAVIARHLLVESGDSYASFDRTADGWTVRQGGRRALWDRIEPAVAAWKDAGEPPLTEFTITVTPERQTIGFGVHSWNLPSSASTSTPT